MRQTNNFFLKLFDGTDKFDYNIMNENFQRVDDAVNELLTGGNGVLLPYFSVKANPTGNGYIIGTHDARTDRYFEVRNGETPVKGVNYYTEAEKEELIQEILNRIG